MLALFLFFMFFQVFWRDALHTIDLNLNVRPGRERVRHLINRFLMHLQLKSCRKNLNDAHTHNQVQNLNPMTQIKTKILNKCEKWKWDLSDERKILTCIQWMDSPGPVNNFLWQMWHLKCFAFWCWMRIFSSSNSRLQYLGPWSQGFQ